MCYSKNRILNQRQEEQIVTWKAFANEMVMGNVDTHWQFRLQSKPAFK